MPEDTAADLGLSIVMDRRTPADREWLSEEMRREQAERAQHHGGSVSPDYTAGLLFLAAGLVMEALLVLSLRLPRRDPVVKAAAA
jgi:hypothetical protein